MRLTFIVAGLALAACVRPAAAQTGSVDTQLWTQVVATVRLSDNWRLHLEGQPRWHEDMSESFQIISRAGVGRRLHERVTAWGGYAWVAKPPGPGVTHEHRVWQQLSLTLPGTAGWSPSMRARLEQRVQDSWDGTSHRLRLMGRAVRPLGDRSTWSVVAWNEAFFTLDDTSPGPAQGVDQNRLFAGVVRQLHPKAAFEFGYLWNTAKPPAGSRTHAHVLFAWLNLTP